MGSLAARGGPLRQFFDSPVQLADLREDLGRRDARAICVGKELLQVATLSLQVGDDTAEWISFSALIHGKRLRCKSLARGAKRVRSPEAGPRQQGRRGAVRRAPQAVG